MFMIYEGIFVMYKQCLMCIEYIYHVKKQSNVVINRICCV